MCAKVRGDAEVESCSEAKLAEPGVESAAKKLDKGYAAGGGVESQCGTNDKQGTRAAVSW